ncbi:MAG: response regulator, partial [Bacteroidales bacterium]
MATILLVEDDVSFCLMLKTWLQKRGFKIQEAFSCRDAFKCLKDQSFDLVLTDMRLPDQDGLFLLNHLKSVQPSTPVILMTGYAEIPTAVQAIKAGAFDYVTKPFLPEQILAKIEDALSLPDADTTHKSTAFHYITGNTPGAIRLADAIRLVAPTRMSVLIRGESGTGKEYIARM